MEMRNASLLTAAAFTAVLLSGGARAVETDLYGFRGGNDGADPIGRIVIYKGALYGVTLYGGGRCGCGAIFKLDLSTLKESIVYSFNWKDAPKTGLIESRGILYGGTVWGRVYSFNTMTGALSTVATVKGHATVTGLLKVGTTLYAICGASGTVKVYKINSKNQHKRLLSTFEGYIYDGPILNAGLLVVPVTISAELPNGGIVTIDPETGTLNTLYAFSGGNDAASPETSLFAVPGMLYGASFSGGAYGKGTIYSINATTGAENVLYSFSDNPDAANPDGSLIEHNNNLWGVSVDGGTDGYAPPSGGTVFYYNLGTGVEDVAYSFQSAQYQYHSPEAGLVFYKNAFYGTTFYGGTWANGSIFKVTAK